MKFLFYAAVIYLIILILLYIFQRSLIYLPSMGVYTPQEAGLSEMQVVELTPEDQLRIKSWYYPAPNVSAPTIIYFHGNAGNIADRAFIAKRFIEEGYGFFLLTYRGYSGNPGRPSEEGLYRDARAAIRYLLDRGVSPLVLYGNSIGASVAIQMATEFQVEAVVLQAPFTSLEDVARIHYGFFGPFIGFIKDKYHSVEKVSLIKSPILILHGKDDSIIPPELSRELFEEFKGNKEEIYLPGRGHNDLFEPELVIDFIERKTQ